MSVKRLERIGQFTGIDATGKQHMVLVFQTFVSQATLDPGPIEETPGTKSLKTGAGDHVNKIGVGQYEIVLRSGERIPITTTDPNAP